MKVVAECGRAGEVVFVGEVGEGDVRLQQVQADLHDGVCVDGLLGRFPVSALDDAGQVTGGDGELVIDFLYFLHRKVICSILRNKLIIR